MNYALEETTWHKNSSLSNRRYNDIAFVIYGAKSEIYCAIEALQNCADCQYFSYEEQLDSRSCYGYKLEALSGGSFEFIPGAVVFEKQLGKAGKFSYHTHL